ncbi:MAG: hypothetical protein PF450_10055 [Bacteroidales bacterium]|jgi:hypothetical protein|nr:hypothetical protein [Bacteroidales bacterium]
MAKQDKGGFGFDTIADGLVKTDQTLKDEQETNLIIEVPKIPATAKKVVKKKSEEKAEPPREITARPRKRHVMIEEELVTYFEVIAYESRSRNFGALINEVLRQYIEKQKGQ